jgi:outer membrane protein OmpA-like peptidoglycan-associated protein
VTTDGAGHLTIDTVINYTVKDTVDLCPGDCGAPAERLATVPMSQWEASGISGDIPFTVDFTVRGRTLHLTVPPPPPAPPAPPPTHLHTVPAEALFDFDSDRLRPDAATAIETELGTAPSRADLTRPVVVVGHTDSIPGPDPAYNQRLSERRAEAVKALLERRYPNLRGHVVAVGRGDTQPIAPNRLNGHDNPAGRARNRRVDIELQEVLPGAGP